MKPFTVKELEILFGDNIVADINACTCGANDQLTGNWHDKDCANFSETKQVTEKPGKKITSKGTKSNV